MYIQIYYFLLYRNYNTELEVVKPTNAINISQISLLLKINEFNLIF